MTETTREPRNTGGAIAKAAAGKAAVKSERATMQAAINKMMPQIIRALPKHLDGERFTRMFLTQISVNPALAKCTFESTMGAVMQVAQLGLEVGPLGEAYLIPYSNNKERRMECQLQLSYKGLLTLLYRSGQAVSVQAQTVHENDEFSYELGLHPDLKHIPARSNRGSAIAYYAVVNLKDGGFLFEVMSREDVENHAKRYSQSYGKSASPWSGDSFDSMAKKTVLKRCLKYAPLSATLMRQMAADGAVKTELAPDMTEIAGTYVVDDDTGEVVVEVDAPAESEVGN